MPTEVAATAAVVIIYAAISIVQVVPAALVAVVRIDRATGCARRLRRFVGSLVDVLVVIASRTLHCAATGTAATQARRVAGRVDRITRRTAATSCKSQKTTAGEYELAHVYGFHALPPRNRNHPAWVSMCSSIGSR
jgi:hypothetical protein